MNSISTSNYGYGNFPIKPRETKSTSTDEKEPTEQPLPSGSGGVQGGKVALQAGGTLLGAGLVGGGGRFLEF